MSAEHGTRGAVLVTRANLVLSLLLVVPLLVAYSLYDSQLALAQAADSVTDSLMALALLISLRVSAQPPDADHPGGHQRAEPVAALMVAVMAGVLAIEVAREATSALLSHSAPRLEWPLAAVFATKVVAKGGVWWAARRHCRRFESAAVRALEVDARNDMAVGVLALLGFYGARHGSPGWDAWLALPVALWIGWAGLSLARENIGMLMGEAAPSARRDALSALACSVPGVLSVHNLIARFEGSHLEVTMHVVVDEHLTVRDAHDIAEAVEARLEREQDVHVAMVHVDVEPDDPGEAPS